MLVLFSISHTDENLFYFKTTTTDFLYSQLDISVNHVSPQQENQTLSPQLIITFPFLCMCGDSNNWYKKFSNSNIKGNLLDFLDKLELFTNSCFLQIFH